MLHSGVERQASTGPTKETFQPTPTRHPCQPREAKQRPTLGLHLPNTFSATSSYLIPITLVQQSAATLLHNWQTYSSNRPAPKENRPCKVVTTTLHAPKNAVHSGKKMQGHGKKNEQMCSKSCPPDYPKPGTPCENCVSTKLRPRSTLSRSGQRSKLRPNGNVARPSASKIILPPVQGSWQYRRNIMRCWACWQSPAVQFVLCNSCERLVTTMEQLAKKGAFHTAGRLSNQLPPP
jgi:hypothetical protein